MVCWGLSLSNEGKQVTLTTTKNCTVNKGNIKYLWLRALYPIKKLSHRLLALEI